MVESYRTSGDEDFTEFVPALNCKPCYMGLGTDAKPGMHVCGMEFNHAAMETEAEVLRRFALKRITTQAKIILIRKSLPECFSGKLFLVNCLEEAKIFIIANQTL